MSPSGLEMAAQTSSGEEITERWAQVWFGVADLQWGAVIDLVRGKAVSLTD